MPALITLTDVCSDIPIQMYVKNIVEVSHRVVNGVNNDGRPTDQQVGSVVLSRPGNYIDNVWETPDEIAAMIVAAGGIVTYF